MIIFNEDAEQQLAHRLKTCLRNPEHHIEALAKQILDCDPKAYVVMFHVDSYIDNITHALNAEASGFVPKPFGKEKMRHYIEDCAIVRHGP